MGDRRELIFGRIEDVMPEVERLLAGHSTHGSWSLGQILNHLTTAIRLSLDPSMGLTGAEPAPGLERGFEIRRRRLFKLGKFPAGMDVPLPIMIPESGLDERAEAEAFRDELGRLRASEGPFATHPWLGTMTKPQWLDFHRMHCEHHLSFVRISPLGR